MNDRKNFEELMRFNLKVMTQELDEFDENFDQIKNFVMEFYKESQEDIEISKLQEPMQESMKDFVII